MCFSNLPIEFDENGDPHLKEEAEEVERPVCDCDLDADIALEETDPRDAYDELVDALPEDVTSLLDDGEEAESALRSTSGRD